jgi:hypothetical protein
MCIFGIAKRRVGLLVYGTESCLLGANWSGDAEVAFCC